MRNYDPLDAHQYLVGDGFLIQTLGGLMDVERQAVKHDFRAAYRADILEWSWGAIDFPRSSSPRWQDKKGTLEDESIFGPHENYRCFCGKFIGQEFADLFCHICWSIIEKSDSRQTKCATIALYQPIPHPFEDVLTDLWVIPVLPAGIREVHTRLDSLYDQIVVNRHSPPTVRPLYDAIIAHVWPSFSTARDDNTKLVLARGLALTPRHEAQAPRAVPLWKARICTKCHEGWRQARGEEKGDASRFSREE